MRRAFSLLAATAMLAAAATPNSALAQNVRLGALSCDVSGGIGLVITSKKALRCIYTPEGGGTLLDNCMLVYGAGISDGDRHNHDDLPILLAGGGAGTLQPGQHLRFGSVEAIVCNAGALWHAVRR